MQSNLQEVLEAIKNGESVITNVDINLSNANLSNANLTGANLSDANLSSANLSSADLSNAILTGANLSNAILTGANLSDANLSSAILTGANLSNANLSSAILTGADLSYAILTGADLINANLSNANLSNAILTGADLSYAILTGADLSNAILTGANLSDANLSGAKNIPDLISAQLLMCPQNGSFQAYKQLRDNCIALLEIPEDALRSSATTRKCRASKAIVLKIWDKNGNELSEKSSWYNPNFLYKVGETVYPDSFDENRWDECSNGIHFFMTKEEADDW